LQILFCPGPVPSVGNADLAHYQPVEGNRDLSVAPAAGLTDAAGQAEDVVLQGGSRRQLDLLASPGGRANALDNPTGPVEEADGRGRRARVAPQDTRPPVELEYRDLIEDARNPEGHQTSTVVGSAWDRSNRLLVLTFHVLEIIGLPTAKLKSRR
jgi:hypothetical protein